MSFVKISEVVSDVAQLSGDPAAMEAAYIVEVAQKEIIKVMGEKSEENVWALRYKDGILTFGVVSSVWAHEIKMKERGLCKSVNLKLPQEFIKKIKSVVEKRT